jgi:N-succinyldiaminopimelate aminotransferase
VAPQLNRRLAGFTTTIFAEMSALAAATGAINLGQGFPDTDGPVELVEAAVTALRAGPNQYPPGAGVPELRSAVSGHQRAFYGLEYDPVTEVLVTTGATEAIAASLLALCETGDEVVMFEPFYDSYAACTALAGARPSVVTLRPPDWSFDPDQLAAAVTPRSRVLLLNSPHNPTGKVFDHDELATIARCCVEHDLIAVTDEVYEHLIFEGEHLPLAGFPGMAERTVSISSAGKTFSFTGWKVGWACAPAPLLAAVRAVKQFLTYVSGGPFQYAVAGALNAGDRYFAGIVRSLHQARDLFCAGLADIGFAVHRPAATYFVTTDISPLGEQDAMAFCLALPERCGVVAVPVSVFFADPASPTGRSLVRWAFSKRPEVLTEALSRLKVLAP